MITPKIDWIEIPEKGYHISKYPVTNAQFSTFIEAGGYSNSLWWTKRGWKVRQEGWSIAEQGIVLRDDIWKPSNSPWTEPRFWHSKKWNGDLQPVVGISWYEAVAFCLWLSDATDESIMLPTEDEWRYAAQGNDGRTYPWGNNWESDRCTHSVHPKKRKSTTYITKWEGKGDSPSGVVDMTGNVWEWCINRL